MGGEGVDVGPIPIILPFLNDVVYCEKIEECFIKFLGLIVWYPMRCIRDASIRSSKYSRPKSTEIFLFEKSSSRLFSVQETISQLGSSI
jgi:hypothetical protein